MHIEFVYSYEQHGWVYHNRHRLEGSARARHFGPNRAGMCRRDSSHLNCMKKRGSGSRNRNIGWSESAAKPARVRVGRPTKRERGEKMSLNPSNWILKYESLKLGPIIARNKTKYSTETWRWRPIKGKEDLVQRTFRWFSIQLELDGWNFGARILISHVWPENLRRGGSAADFCWCFVCDRGTNGQRISERTRANTRQEINRFKCKKISFATRWIGKTTRKCQGWDKDAVGSSQGF